MNLLNAAKAALDALWDCTSKLESQLFRNPIQLPDTYREIVASGFTAHANLRAAIEEAERAEPVAEVVQVYGGGGGMVRMLPNAKTPPVGTQLYVGYAPTIPKGWKLVPIEPTPEMQNVMDKGSAYNTWRNMLDTAPPPPKEKP